MDIRIEIDEIEARRTLTLREKAGIKILILLFRVIYPAKYAHQGDNFFKDLLNGVEGK
jgi:hypothetical protein